MKVFLINTDAVVIYILNQFKFRALTVNHNIEFLIPEVFLTKNIEGKGSSLTEIISRQMITASRIKRKYFNLFRGE